MGSFRLPLVEDAIYVDGGECQSTKIVWKKFQPCSHPARYEILDAWYTKKNRIQLCGRHYWAVHHHLIKVLPNTVGEDPIFYHGAIGKWRLAALDEVKEVQRLRKTRYEWEPGRFRDRNIELTDMDTGGATRPLSIDDPVLVTDIHHNQTMQLYSSAFVSFFNGQGRPVSTPELCSVCGRGGYVGYKGHLMVNGSAKNLGPIHKTCFQWLSDHADEVGIVHHKYCGHFTMLKVLKPVPTSDSPTPDLFTCKDCGDVFDQAMPRADAAVAASGRDCCPDCTAADMRGRRRTFVGVYEGYSRKRVRCDACADQFRHTEEQRGLLTRVRSMGVESGRDLFRAVADFYTLMYLGFLDPEAEEALQGFAGELAEQFYHYGTLACGGELRHGIGDGRASALQVVAEKTKQLTEAEPADMYWCAIHRTTMDAHNDDCWAKGQVYPVIGVFGAVNTPPLSKKGRLDQEKLVFSYTQDVTVGGVEYKVYRPDPAVWATITKALSKDGSGYRKTERFDAWGRWHKLMQSERALEYLDTCAAVFNTGSWGGGIGGPLWGTGAMLCSRYRKGELSPVQFVDLVFGLQHNGGPFLNKTYMTGGYYRHLNELLDIKREDDSAERLLGWASPAALDIWIAVYNRTKDPDLLPGVAAIREARQYPHIDKPAVFNGIVKRERKALEQAESNPAADDGAAVLAG